MPNYLYQNPTNGQVKQVWQHMNDQHTYQENGIVFNRVWTIPNAAIDTHCDPYSTKDYVKATAKGGTLGDMFDRSKELSLKRADKEGIDPVRQSFYDNYQKTHKGRKHPAQQREESVRVAKDAGISIDYGSDDD